jgi:NTP pyrophosphatase (non-canonical NTP hydrolase)
VTTEIKLPRLNNLSPTVESTFFKIIEEAGELARCVLAFLPYEDLAPGELLSHRQAQVILGEVCSELLDVAQTCVTMIFVLEENYQVDMAALIKSHLGKLGEKGYVFDGAITYFISSEADFKYLHLPRLHLKGVTLLKTACKLQEEIGEAGQYWGKGRGKSGEASLIEVPGEADLIHSYSLELLDIAQCCFTMMYILQDKYGIDYGVLVERHLDKLRRKGYCR